MTRIVYYKADQTIEKYDDGAINDYVKRQKAFITKASNDLGVSQINNAIAGAMAEENNGYIARVLIYNAHKFISFYLLWRTRHATSGTN